MDAAAPTISANTTSNPSTSSHCGDPPLRLLDLPVEVLMQVSLELSCVDFSRFLQTNRALHNALNTHYIWHQRFLIRFGQPLLTTKLRELGLLHQEPEQQPQEGEDNDDDDDEVGHSSAQSTPPPTTTTGSSSDYFNNHQASQSTSTTSSTPSSFISDGHNSSTASSPRISPSRSNDNSPRDLKGKGKKIEFDIRKTNGASKEVLIDLYRELMKLTIPADKMAIVHLGNRYWRMVGSSASQFGKLAQLDSVWWMDVAATFASVPKGRYKVQWRLQVKSEAPVVGSEFRVVLFDRWDPETGINSGLQSMKFKPKSMHEFTQQTDSLITKTDRQPFRRLFKGSFTILELPGELVIDEEYSGVYVQIRNHDGWKSGLSIDFVRLVDMDDPAKEAELLVRRVDPSPYDEEVNDEGENDYPSSSSSASHSWLPSTFGINPRVPMNPLAFRSRGVRQFHPVTDPSILNVGARSPTTPGAFTSQSGPGSASLPPGAQGDTSSSTTSAQPRSNSSNNRGGGAAGDQFEWYKFFAVLFLYCLYVAWTR
ncbi:hypothetical protein BGZ83_008535 [Gryganskiella cystojenkinii]|nr:hypothetical protein BGZ83_008535 [Gryganskiella cystojenkinii]